MIVSHVLVLISEVFGVLRNTCEVSARDGRNTNLPGPKRDHLFVLVFAFGYIILTVGIVA
jgi:hypothetical protein